VIKPTATTEVGKASNLTLLLLTLLLQWP